MKFDRNALELMPHTVLIRKRLQVDRYNRPTYETDAAGEPVYTSYRALVTYKPEEVRTASGEERVSRSRVTLAPVVVNEEGTIVMLDVLPVITPEDEITLPDESKPVIIAVERHDALEDFKHYVIRT